MSASREPFERRKGRVTSREVTARGVLRAWLIGFITIAILVAVLAAWVDRPIASLMNALVGRPAILRMLIGTPAFFAPFAAVVLVFFAIRRFAARPFGRPDEALLVGLLSLLIGLAAKPILKVLFGRTWPYVLLKEGVYGFFPFRVGPEYASFPSGHTAAVWSIASVVWIFYPALRLPAAAAAVLFAVALVGANYHFVSDVIAGGFFGITTTLGAIGIWRLIGPRFGVGKRTLR